MPRRKKASPTEPSAGLILGVFIVLAVLGGISSLDAQSITLFILIVGIVVAIALVVGIDRLQKTQFRNLLTSGIDEIDQMTGIQFEHRLAAHFIELGFTVETTKTSGDMGADLVLRKGTTRTVAQLKRYSKPVGLGAVQEAIAALPIYKAKKALVITNTTFTKSAITLAKANNTELWDRHRLITELAKTYRPPKA